MLRPYPWHTRCPSEHLPRLALWGLVPMDGLYLGHPPFIDLSSLACYLRYIPLRLSLQYGSYTITSSFQTSEGVSSHAFQSVVRKAYGLNINSQSGLQPRRILLQPFERTLLKTSIFFMTTQADKNSACYIRSLLRPHFHRLRVLHHNQSKDHPIRLP